MSRGDELSYFDRSTCGKATVSALWRAVELLAGGARCERPYLGVDADCPEADADLQGVDGANWCRCCGLRREVCRLLSASHRHTEQQELLQPSRMDPADPTLTPRERLLCASQVFADAWKTGDADEVRRARSVLYPALDAYEFEVHRPWEEVARRLLGDAGSKFGPDLRAELVRRVADLFAGFRELDGKVAALEEVAARVAPPARRKTSDGRVVPEHGEEFEARSADDGLFHPAFVVTVEEHVMWVALPSSSGGGLRHLQVEGQDWRWPGEQPPTARRRTSDGRVVPLPWEEFEAVGGDNQFYPARAVHVGETRMRVAVSRGEDGELWEYSIEGLNWRWPGGRSP